MGTVLDDRPTTGLQLRDDILQGTLPRLLDYTRSQGQRSYEHVEPNLVPIAIFGAISFPVYYVVWVILFPQGYESLSLRLVGTGLCLLLASKNRWPQRIRRIQRTFFLLVVLYCLPFFFTYMMLQNDASTVWLLSTLTALFLLVLLVDWFHLIVLFVLGSLLACGTFALINPEFVNLQVYLEYFPIFVFVILAGTIFNYKAEFIRQERLRAINEAAISMSNQLRAPLQMIKTGAASLTKYMPQLVEGMELAKKHHHPLGDIDPGHLRAVSDVPGKIDTEIEHALAVVDMLLVNSGSAPGDTSSRIVSEPGSSGAATRISPSWDQKD
jgi:two-component system CAI-1 autoinducer sensor kinase/phosphatase CqsS